MNEAKLVQVVEPELVALEDTSTQESSSQPNVRELEVALSPTIRAAPLGRALLVSIGVALLLAVIAFWPSGPRPAVPRPTLKAPIVFDVLNAAPLPQTGANSEPLSSATSPGQK
jgi:hypothetical protein